MSLFPGIYDDGIAWLNRYAENNDLYVCNSVNPWRIEGQKSIVFELAQDLGWELPDWIVLPGGALSNAAALGKGLRELHELGLIAKLPRVAIVQAEGASPFHRMVATGAAALEPEPRPATVASALNIGHPPSWRKARRTLELTNGVTAAVSDREIMDAKAVIDRSGIGCEPASAAALAGLRNLVRDGVVHREETAVCLLTGNILKDTASIDMYYAEVVSELDPYGPHKHPDDANAHPDDANDHQNGAFARRNNMRSVDLNGDFYRARSAE